MSSPPQPIVLDRSSERTELRLYGEVRIEHAAELHAQLSEAAGRSVPIRVDWSAAEHLDACVLQLLAALARRCVRTGLRLEFAEPGPALRHYLELSGFQAHLRDTGAVA